MLTTPIGICNEVTGPYCDRYSYRSVRPAWSETG
jgi:hypothetical protein